MIKYIKQSQNSFINISSEIVKTKFVFCWNRWKFLCLLMLKSLEFCSVVYWQLSIDTFIWIINSLWRKFLLPDYHNQSPNHIFTLIVRLLPRFCKALCVRNNFPLLKILTEKKSFVQTIYYHLLVFTSSSETLFMEWRDDIIFNQPFWHDQDGVD